MVAVTLFCGDTDSEGVAALMDLQPRIAAIISVINPRAIKSVRAGRGEVARGTQKVGGERGGAEVEMLLRCQLASSRLSRSCGQRLDGWSCRGRVGRTGLPAKN